MAKPKQHVADEIGMLPSQYCKYEKNETSLTLETLEKICSIYKLRR